MDPKMDSGIVSTYCSVDEAIEKGAAPVPLSFNSTIDIQCTIDIIDHLLACEVSISIYFFPIVHLGRNDVFSDKSIIFQCRRHGIRVIHLHKLFSLVSTF